jgi:ABC-2 type transport system ATP-binding protein
MAESVLALQSVSKSFRDVQAVCGLSVEVPGGCIYGFLGPNGAGKTTTLRMILDIIRPDSGAIQVFGNRSASDSKDRIGYLPEERGLYPKMRVRDVLVYLGRLKGLDKATARTTVTRWLGTLDLGGWADRRVDDLSHGMQQRLQFAAAVVHSPALLILDEPFSGLDPVNVELVKAQILSLRDGGATVVLCTHMMEQAESVCDSILLIHSGRKVLDGRLDEVLKQDGAQAVMVELEGDAGFVRELPMVAEVTPSGREIVVVLKDGADDQVFLRSLLDRTRVRAFRPKVPTLREVFVRAVKSATG